MDSTKIGVLGLGYVGLPVALAFAEKFDNVIGYDINADRVKLIQQGVDPTEEGFDSKIKSSTLKVTDCVEDIKTCNFYVVTVPTPIDNFKNPDLKPLELACQLLAKVVKKNDIIVFESTVYPGLTEEFCGLNIEKLSGLKSGQDFFLGYSPERINPGDRQRTIDKIVKVVSGQNQKVLEIISNVYSKIITAGIYQATSIKVAEAAKVIENTQRDLNIALMNELSIIFNRLGIKTKDVLEAASTKWNFLKFTPGLVGGHCIGVDPYYLTSKAKSIGYYPQVVLAGRRINDDMGVYVAQQVIKRLISLDIHPKKAKVGILGVTFKENISDLRNSLVPQIGKELQTFGCNVYFTDPKADPKLFEQLYEFSLSKFEQIKDIDALILAVPHSLYTKMEPAELILPLKKGGLFVDVKNAIDSSLIDGYAHYWSL